MDGSLSRIAAGDLSCDGAVGSCGATAVEVTVKTGDESVPDITLDESRYVSVPHKNKFGQDYPASAYEKKEDGR